MTHDDQVDESAADDGARDELAALARGLRGTAAAAALTGLGMGLAEMRFDELVAGPLVVGVPVAFLSVFCLWQVVRFTPASVDRLEAFALRAGGRFTPVADGARGYTATPFRHGDQPRRFGVVRYGAHGTRIEIGHLLSSSAHPRAQLVERRHAYAVIELPERMPQMVLDFGHLRSFLGIRLTPEHWDRSQLVDVGGGRRFRLFVAEGGEHVARRFFTADVVRAFEEVGRHYDVEIDASHLYLLSMRSAASGSDRRWEKQRNLIEGLAGTVVGSPVWDDVRGPRRGRGPRSGSLVMDVKRGVRVVLAAATAAVVVLSAIVLHAQGLLPV
ncbi:hypothetical protein L615_010200000060 [Nocardioides sp. J9]|uniref:hypothetical protein n=1 Tax=Nocardioides sp. J9 TaxID=935844 RepID=UPI0011A4B21F|nr:hypothetical protein [Nocardioides sp. J9]TWH04245.1 hypothetical protein L615_010200000060 [Nocardioides sp. J9]